MCFVSSGLALRGDGCRVAKDRRLRKDPNSFLRFDPTSLLGQPLQRSKLAPKSSRLLSSTSE